MIPAITVSARLEPVPDVPVLLDHYEGALRRFGASVERLPGNRLWFDVPWSRPKGLGRWEADLGLVRGGFLDVINSPNGCEVRVTARPRGWLLAVCFTPWLLLLWALGWAPAPWRWLLALGGLPLPAIAWVLVWANLDAFLADANTALKSRDVAPKSDA